MLCQLSGAEEDWHNRVSHILSEPKGLEKHLAGRTSHCYEVIPNPHPSFQLHSRRRLGPAWLHVHACTCRGCTVQWVQPTQHVHTLTINDKALGVISDIDRGHLRWLATE